MLQNAWPILLNTVKANKKQGKSGMLSQPREVQDLKANYNVLSWMDPKKDKVC